MRRISRTISAVLLGGALFAPVWTAQSASAAPCPTGEQPGAPAPLPTLPPTPAGAISGYILGGIVGSAC
jgi:hypothetical protein